MYWKQFVTILLLIFIAILSYQSYSFMVLEKKLDDAKIGFGCNTNAPAVNLTDGNNQVPDMVGGC